MKVFDLKMSQDGSVNSWLGYERNKQGIVLDSLKRQNNVLNSAYQASGNHLRALFSRVKRPVHELTNLLHPIPRLRVPGDLPQLPPVFSM
jgi:hypothetical protein